MNHAASSGRGRRAATRPCARCRQRRVKCDKTHPSCRRCESYGQPCPGFDRVRGFVDEGPGLRDRNLDDSARSISHDASSPSSINRTRRDRVTLRQGSQPSEEFNSNSPASSIQQPHTSIAGEWEPSMSSWQTVDSTTSASHVGETLGNSTNGDAFDEALFFDLDPDAYYADARNCCGFVPNAPSLFSNSGSAVLQSTSSFTIPELTTPLAEQVVSNADTERSTTSSEQDADQEMQLLIQHFSAHIGPALDVFDMDKYFTCVVPAKALQSTLLMNLLAAISAKHFGKWCRKRVKVAHASPPGLLLFEYNGRPVSEWLYKAASFYDRAIALMVRSLTGFRETANSTMTGAEYRPRSGLLRDLTGLGRDAIDPDGQKAEGVSDLLVAAPLLLFYESLDHSKTGMLSHMMGAYYLLEINMPRLDSNTDDNTNDAILHTDVITAWRAAFWHVAHADFILSCTERTRPQIDTGNQLLWETAGLPMYNEGSFAVPQSLRSLDTGSGTPMTSTAAYRALLWIMLDSMGLLTINVDCLEQYDTAGLKSLNIDKYLETWVSAVPSTFQPIVTFPPRERPDVTNGLGMSFRTTANAMSKASNGPVSYYSSSLSSTTMGYYHAAKLLVLLHKPPVSLSNSSGAFPQFVSSRMNSITQTSLDIFRNATKICEICLGQPRDMKRLQMAQPLHLAGLCLNSNDHRLVVDNLLGQIEEDSGFSMQWIVAGLRKEWGFLP